MPNDRRRHYRLTLDDALDAHAHALCFGGRQGVINLGSIKSAIARPYSVTTRTIGRGGGSSCPRTLSSAPRLVGRGQLHSCARPALLPCPSGSPSPAQPQALRPNAHVLAHALAYRRNDWGPSKRTFSDHSLGSRVGRLPPSRNRLVPTRDEAGDGAFPCRRSGCRKPIAALRVQACALLD